MDISVNYIRNCLKTLPIGYYAKRNIRLELSETSDCSFYSQSEDSITISYKQLLPVLQKVTDETNIETAVRCMLYHEVSHAIATPEKMEMTRERNIVEDERIETIFKDFYMDVNFKQFVKDVNEYVPGSAKTAEEAFYALVRFREGTSYWLNRLSDLLIQHQDLDRTFRHVIHYQNAIDSFANDFYDWYKQNSDQSDPSEQDDPSINNDMGVDSLDGLSSINNNIDQTLASLAKDQFQKVIQVKDQSIINSFSRIINNVAKLDKNNGSSINTYSGVFDPRSVERDDYKFFVQKNRLGNIKKYAKIHLNLFIDRSGSFSDSELFVNQLIYSLGLLERSNPDFTFTLITCGVGQTICDKRHRELSCYDGTFLDNEIFEQFKQVQVSNASNFNIVLYDGDAFYSSWEDTQQYAYRFKAFDTKNTLIITDRSNKRYLSKTITQAKYIICDNYADELYKQLLVNLEKLLR